MLIIILLFSSIGSIHDASYQGRAENSGGLSRVLLLYFHWVDDSTAVSTTQIPTRFASHFFLWVYG